MGAGKPRLLDLFCCAGGCSEGYWRAGFEVTGVDVKPQRHYPSKFTFVQADAIEYCRAHGHEFDAIHASPPCQAHSSLRPLQPTKTYPDLIPATRAALQATGKPYVIENVPGAPLGESGFLLVLCGTMFGLVTPDGRAEIRRHRLFECSFCFGLRPACQHGGSTLCVVGNSPEDRSGPRLPNGRRAVRHRDRKVLTVVGHTPVDNTFRSKRAIICVGGGKAMSGGMSKSRAFLAGRAKTERETFTVDDARAAMGIDWMPMEALSQAIPPAYTEWLGKRLLEHLGAP